MNSNYMRQFLGATLRVKRYKLLVSRRVNDIFPERLHRDCQSLSLSYLLGHKTAGRCHSSSGSHGALRPVIEFAWQRFASSVPGNVRLILPNALPSYCSANLQCIGRTLSVS